MRQDKREKIDTLLLKQLSGSLSSAETAALQQFTDEYADVKLLGRALQTRMATADAQLFKQSLDAKKDWPLLLSRINENKRQTFQRRFKLGLLFISLMSIIVYSYALLFRNMGTKRIPPVPPATVTRAVK